MAKMFYSNQSTVIVLLMARCRLLLRELVPEVGMDVRTRITGNWGQSLTREEIVVICDNRRILDGSYSEIIVYS